jgi:hypothetical protein
MATIKIPREEMLDILGSEDEVQNTIVGHRRWSVDHEMIFKYNGKLYRANYSVGATESQDEGPWEYEDEVEVTEVNPVEKTVIVYEAA